MLRRVWASAIAVATALAAAGVSYAAFTDTSANSAAVQAGTLALTDDDGEARAFDLSGLTPSSPAESRCLRVRYEGSMAATVRLHGSSSGSLAPHLRLTVSRGAGPHAGFPSCAGFVSAETLYEGSLSVYPSGWTGGLEATPAPWAAGESHVFRLTVSLEDDSAAQGASAAAAFGWEAR